MCKNITRFTMVVGFWNTLPPISCWLCLFFTHVDGKSMKDPKAFNCHRGCVTCMLRNQDIKRVSTPFSSFINCFGKLKYVVAPGWRQCVNTVFTISFLVMLNFFFSNLSQKKMIVNISALVSLQYASSSVVYVTIS